MNRKKTRIGLFGGTFNPMHIGHVQLVRSAQRIAQLNAVYCIPTGVAPHKDNNAILPFIERCDGVVSKIRCERCIALSTIEEELPSPSYTWRTLAYFKRSFPYIEHYFISGSQDFINIDTWNNGIEILQEANYIIAPRYVTDVHEIELYLRTYIPSLHKEEKKESTIFSSACAEYIYLHIPSIPISSTEIRKLKEDSNERANAE